MKTLLVAINAKYIHSNLAVWYIKANCNNECGDVEVIEFSINDHTDHLLAEIYRNSPDNVAFSCYIWNVDIVMKLIKNLRKINKNIKIILGGPEASSFDLEDINLDYLVLGEGDIKVPTLLKHINNQSLEKKFFTELGENTLIKDINLIKSPYTEEMLRRTKNKIVYYEASRGCPFNCSYCLSSTIKGVRYFDIGRVKEEISLLVENKVRQIKFVDRTFNCNLGRTKEILKYIYRFKDELINFHFEISAGIFDDALFDIIEQLPAGLVQFEIGIQSTNNKTLEAINRSINITKELLNIKRLIALENVHIHVDLIAGLPYEDFKCFMDSFDTVYQLQAHHFQLGFLKLLRGTEIYNNAEKYSFVYKDYAPYEVLYNDFLSYDEISFLKDIEECLERYYNSMRFRNSLEYIIKAYFDDSPSDFYKAFAIYNRKNGFLERSISSRELYTVIKDFVGSLCEHRSVEGDRAVLELLKLDFLISDRSMRLPECIKSVEKGEFKTQAFEFLKNEANVKKYLSSFMGTPPKEIFKQTYIGKLALDVKMYMKDCKQANVGMSQDVVILIDYSNKNQVTGLYNFAIIEEKDFI